jgi:hypothetical protein
MLSLYRAEVRLNGASNFGNAFVRPLVVMCLRDGLKSIRGIRRTLTEDEQHKVADAIVAHLESHNWKIEKGPPVEGHGQYIIPPR